MRLKNNIFFRVFSVLILVTLLQAASSPGARAQTSCDPQYMDALEARAWMEAQREIAMNQNLILKPDSVLEYSCFENFLEHIASQNLFSDSGCCGASGLGGGTLAGALAGAVADAMQNYVQANFGHSFRGGRSSVDSESGAPALDGAVQTNVSYSCAKMQQVWDNAKCANFFSEPAHDGFYDFAWYASNDPRPGALSGINNAGRWSTTNMCSGRIAAADTGVAYNNRANLYVLGTENPWPSDVTPYVNDPIAASFDLLLPVGATNPTTSAAVACADPIATGVCVRRTGGVPEYPDAVCPNPGCHYVPSPAAGRCGPPVNMTGATCAP